MALRCSRTSPVVIVRISSIWSGSHRGTETETDGYPSTWRAPVRPPQRGVARRQRWGRGRSGEHTHLAYETSGDVHDPLALELTDGTLPAAVRLASPAVQQFDPAGASDARARYRVRSSSTWGVRALRMVAMAAMAVAPTVIANVRQGPRGDRAGGKSGEGDDSGFGPDECPELTPVGSERGCDGEGTAAFGEAEPQGQARRGRSESEGETELNLGQTVEVDRGKTGSDDCAAAGDVGDRCGDAKLLAEVSAMLATLLPPVSTRNAPTVSLPVILAM